MTEKELIGKDGGGIGRGLVEVHSWNLPGRNEESHGNLMIVGAPLEIRTRHLSNTSMYLTQLTPWNCVENIWTQERGGA